MQCRKCGAEINTKIREADGSVVCPGCGTVYKPKSAPKPDNTANGVLNNSGNNIEKQKNPQTKRDYEQTSLTSSKKKNSKISSRFLAISCIAVVTVILVVAGIIGRTKTQEKAMLQYNQNVFSTYADLSEIRSYIGNAYKIYLGTDLLSYCRFYEYYNDETIMVLAQFKVTEDDEYRYALFVYDVDLEHFYEYRYDEDMELPLQPTITKLRTENNDLTTYQLSFSYYDKHSDAIRDYSFDQYILCDKYGRILRWIPIHVQNDPPIVSFSYDKNGRIIKAQVFEIEENDITKSLSEDFVLSKSKRCTDTCLYEYNSDGSLHKLSKDYYENDNDSGYYRVYEFEYDTSNFRTKTSYYRWSSTDKSYHLITTMDYIRDWMDMDAIAIVATCTQYEDTGEINWTDSYDIEYLSNGTQHIYD